MMKKLTPVRLLKNKFFQDVLALEEQGASADEMAQLLGKGRAKKGMLEGDLEEGELEVGQVAGIIRDIPKVQNLILSLVNEFENCLNRLNQGQDRISP